MGLIPEIENNSIIAADTTVFIYLIEENPKYFELIKALFERCNSRSKPLVLVTSMITLIEVLTRPLQMKEASLVEKYKKILLTSNNVFIKEIDTQTSEIAATLRAKYNFLRTPDAIQIATAIRSKAEYFISNDKKLKVVSEIKNLVLDELLISVK